MEAAILLWPIIGWACAYFSIPKRMREEDDWFGFFLLVFCGAIVGPFGIFWFYLHKDLWP